MLDQEIWDEFDAVDAAVKKAVPTVVMRYRELGTLTWALLHRIEGEVLDEIKASGEHLDSTLRMIRSSPLFGYPKDDRPVSLDGHDVVPVIFGQIEKVWKFVN